jgi:hypothetical protein
MWTPIKGGIDSMSLNPDSILKITLKIIDLEKNLLRQPGHL